MLPSVSDVDFGQLSPEARWTLENLAYPLSEGFELEELCSDLGIDRREAQQRLSDLEAMITALAGGPRVPALTPEEYQGLRDSIAEHGQLVPILTDSRGLAGLVDGQNRLRICRELGIEPKSKAIVDRELSDDERRRLALVVNVARRQLQAGARRGMIAAELLRDSTQSDRSVATRVGVSHTWVGRVRRELERSAQVETVASRTGQDGRRRRSPTPRPVDNVSTKTRLVTCPLCGHAFEPIERA